MKKIILMAFLIGFLPVFGAAQLKIGYFNPKVVVGQLPEFKEIEGKLQEFAQTKEAEYQKEAQVFQDQIGDYQKKMSSMSEAKRKEEEARLASRRQELSEASVAAQTDIQRKQADLLKPVYDRINDAIQKVAVEMKLDFVFNSSTSSGENILLYVDESQKTKLDITNKVLEKLKK
jgi:outer membrane protein